MTSDGIKAVAHRARGMPRIAGRLLRRIRDFSDVIKVSVADVEFCAHSLNRLGVDQEGLDALGRQYLNHLVRVYNGGPVGVETLTAALSEQRDTLEDVVEPYLIQQGFLQRTPRGRQVTSEAYRILGLETS